MASALPPTKRIGLLLLKPSQYDSDGYVIEWHKVFISTHVVSVVEGILQELNQRRPLPGVSIETRYIEEQTEQVQITDLCAWMDSFDHAAVLLVGVQTSQFPRAVDLGREFTKRGYTVIMGGFHVSGSMAMVPNWAPAFAGAAEAGISLFAGELETHAETLIKDIIAGEVKPVYTMLSITADMMTAPMASLNEKVANGTLQKVTGVDTGRGCPFTCSFCTIINVHGRTMRHRDPAEIEAYVRYWVGKGRRQFLVVDDNFVRSPIWREITDALARVRRETGVELDVFVQVDTLATKVKGFVEACVNAGVRRVFVGMESVRADNLAAASKGQNKIHQMRDMLMDWKRAGVMIYAGYIVGFPADTPERVAEDIRTLQDELPIDILELSILTPFPGSADHKAMVEKGESMASDLNFFDGAHATYDHPTMSRETLQELYWNVFDLYYSRAHRKTVLGRAMYYGLPVSEVRRSLIGIYGAASLDRLHPVDAGVLRKRRRTLRRPGMPIEPALPFYFKLAKDWLGVQLGYGRLITETAWIEAGLALRKKRRGLAEYALEQTTSPKDAQTSQHAAE
jgi:hypothetical protein